MGLRSAVSVLSPVLAFGILPGLGLAWGVARKLGWSLPALISSAFAFSLSLAGIAGFAGRATGFDLTTAWTVTLVLGAAGAVTGTWVGRRRGEGDERMAWGWQGVVLALIAGGVAFWQRPWFAYTPDTFYHMAAARSLIATGRTLVTDPLHGTATTALDPTSGIFHTWLAMLGSHSEIRIQELYLGFTALAAAMIVLAMWALAHRLTRSSWAATFAALGYASMSLMADFRMAGFPNRFSVALVFVVAIALVDLLDGKDAVWAAVTVLLAGFGAIGVHLASAALAVAVAFALLLWAALRGIARHGEADAWRPFVRLAAPLGILAVACVPLLLAKAGLVSASSIVSAGIPEKARETALWFIGERIVLVRPGVFIGGGALAFCMTAAIGAIATWRALWHDEDEALPVAALALLPALLLFDPVTTSLLVSYSYYSLARLALLMSFIPWLALAWAVARASAEKEWHRHILAACAIALGVGHVATMFPYARATYVDGYERLRPGESYTVFESREADVRDGWGTALWDVLVEVGGSYPRVAADPETGYYLAGLAPVSVVAAPDSHSPLAIELESGPQRREDMAALLAPNAGVEARREILERWGAAYVALSPGIGGDAAALASMREQPELFDVVVDSRRLALLRVLPVE